MKKFTFLASLLALLALIVPTASPAGTPVVAAGGTVYAVYQNNSQNANDEAACPASTSTQLTNTAVDWTRLIITNTFAITLVTSCQTTPGITIQPATGIWIKNAADKIIASKSCGYAWTCSASLTVSMPIGSRLYSGGSFGPTILSPNRLNWSGCQAAPGSGYCTGSTGGKTAWISAYTEHAVGV